MRVFIVGSEAEAKAVTDEQTQQGYQWACSSNTGLPAGQWRLTFLPNAIFMDTPIDAPTYDKEER